MPSKPESPQRRLNVPEILDALVATTWSYVGDVEHLVHPSETMLLRLLVHLADERLAALEPGARRERLQEVRAKLFATAELNEVLPMVEAERFGKPFRTAGALPQLRISRRPKRRAVLAGFEAYHDRLTTWLAENDLTQHALARILEVDPSYLSRAIRGERKSLKLFAKIERHTGIAALWAEAEDEPEND